MTSKAEVDVGEAGKSSSASSNTSKPRVVKFAYTLVYLKCNANVD